MAYFKSRFSLASAWLKTPNFSWLNHTLKLNNPYSSAEDDCCGQLELQALEYYQKKSNILILVKKKKNSKFLGSDENIKKRSYYP